MTAPPKSFHVLIGNWVTGGSSFIYRKNKNSLQKAAPLEQGFSDEELIREVPKSTEGAFNRLVAARKVQVGTDFA